MTKLVRPEDQGRGIGRLLISELKKYINDYGVSGTDIFVELCAVPGKNRFMRNSDFRRMRHKDGNFFIM